MGIFKLFRNQISKVILWQPTTSDIVWQKCTSVKDDEVKNASKLIIEPGQGCVLVYEGQIRDILTEPGTYNLQTANHPFITTLLKIRTNFDSEHKLSIYFFKTTTFVGQRWGTPNLIKYLDSIYNFPLNLGLNGNYSYVIKDISTLYTGIIGAKNLLTTADVRAMINSRIIQHITSYLASEKYSYLNIDSKLKESAKLIQANIKGELEPFGLEITDFRIDSTSFDAETLARVADIAEVSADVTAAKEAGIDYVELQKIRALRDVVQNEGNDNLAGAGMQMGVGLDLARQFAGLGKSAPAEAAADDVEKLRKLKLLLDEKIITQAEFDKMKAEIIAKL